MPQSILPLFLNYIIVCGEKTSLFHKRSGCISVAGEIVPLFVAILYMYNERKRKSPLKCFKILQNKLLYKWKRVIILVVG